MNAAVLHTIAALTIILCYTLLTALGHDGNALLAALGGQAIGGLAQKVGSAG